ncbi:hypothetical protein C8R45DRAFT_1215150, partial [Mycena sanguinolenta]
MSRGDIIASRKTRDLSDTPVIQAGTKRKAANLKNGGKAKKTKSDLKKSGLIESKPNAQAQAAEDDSMVAPGGPALNNDAEEHVERPKEQCPKRSSKSLIVVQPAPPNTSEQLWSLWRASLSAVTTSSHGVKPDGPWVGLVNYCLDSWRNGLGSQAHKYMMDLIDSYESGDKDDDEEMGAPQFTSHPSYVRVPFHVFGGIPGAYERLEGPLRSALLMAEQAVSVFRCHDVSRVLLFGPLVHRELKFRRAGEYLNPNKPANYFSALPIRRPR